MTTEIVRIGLCGSHRTGKTTLAKVIAKKKEIPFVETQTSKVFKENGLDPAKRLDIKTRLWIQERVIQAAEEIWEAEPGAYVTDRTPIDMLAYTLGDITGSTDVDFFELNKYMEHCFEVTNRFFSLLAVIQPAIPLVYETGKAALNQAYMEHLNTLILGLCSDERLRCPAVIVKRNIIAIEDRAAAVLQSGRSLFK